MKKTLLTIAIIFTMTFGASAQGGLFGYGTVSDEEYYGATNRTGEAPLLNLPSTHGETDDVTAPLGGGALLLIGFGAAYALKKQKKN